MNSEYSYIKLGTTLLHPKSRMKRPEPVINLFNSIQNIKIVYAIKISNKKLIKYN